MRRVLAGLLLLAGLAACTERGMLAPPTLEPLDLTADGPWLRDRMGRVVLLRGITLSALERGRYVGEVDGPAKADFQELERLGFNVVRVFLSWPSLEPVPGELRLGYLVERVNPIVRLAAQHGMVVILTLHQRGWSRCFPDGLGLPLWSCADRDVAAEPGGLAAAACELFEGGGGLRNDIGLHFISVWQSIAEFYAADRRVIGFDLLEEPPDVTCDSGGSPDLLRKLYRRMARQLQRLRARQVLFYDPTVGPEQGMPLPPPGGVAPIFAPHLFSQTFGRPPGPREVVISRGYAEGAALAEANDLVFFAGEIGAELPEEDGFRGVTAPFVQQSLDALDRHLAGGTIFASGGRSLPQDDAASPLEGAVRPWARRIAGIPKAMRFDRESRSFVLTYGDDPERRTSDPTEIFVPKELYPEGFDVQVLPAGTWTYDEPSQRLLVYRSRAEGHAIRVAPLPGATPAH
jgi:hypothetical protein